MVETMQVNKGMGLAAVQVGILKRLVVIQYEDKLYRLINPKIISSDGEEVAYEGCLSVPGKHMSVKRPLNVKVEALNEDGRTMTIEATGHLARAFCHEIDHLDGILYIQKADYSQPVLYDNEMEETEDAEQQS